LPALVIVADGISAVADPAVSTREAKKLVPSIDVTISKTPLLTELNCAVKVAAPLDEENIAYDVDAHEFGVVGVAQAVDKVVDPELGVVGRAGKATFKLLPGP
jgi:hypothetical protein